MESSISTNDCYDDKSCADNYLNDYPIGREIERCFDVTNVQRVYEYPEYDGVSLFMIIFPTICCTILQMAFLSLTDKCSPIKCPKIKCKKPPCPNCGYPKTHQQHTRHQVMDSNSTNTKEVDIEMPTLVKLSVVKKESEDNSGNSGDKSPPVAIAITTDSDSNSNKKSE